MTSDWIDFYLCNDPLWIQVWSIRLRFTIDIWFNPKLWMLRFGTDNEGGWLCIGPIDFAWSWKEEK